MPVAVGGLRDAAAQAAHEAGALEGVVGRVRLAVSEAATNAVLHAYAEDDDLGTVDLLVDLEAGRLRVEVRDHGRGMRPRTDSPGAGLGLPVIVRVADDVEVRPVAGGGTAVTMCFALAPRPS
ncbi:ATP-binding protein [Conexibacter sp. SYSU D00693]|uniref:ATP-binding protein n=1 Tax=Conexibacter sp. SYSU D00693 TaxID=2812560 RepID=UPI00196B87B1|nr:ATP-binding protein [Conexibacter sp. SYSU D00693]